MRKWNENLAYAIGLFTADGCLYPDKRHLEFNSKDREQVENFKKCLNLDNRITKYVLFPYRYLPTKKI
jgi:hypothetical protein